MREAETTTISDAPDKEDKDNARLQGSFLRAVGRTLKCYKLGSLLVSSGLVTQAELDHALRIHKETGDPLGKVLVRHGVVSAVQVYRKLAEQWCLKASAAGVAMMMQAAAPATAFADEPALQQGNGITAQFTMAAASVNPSALRPSFQAPADTPELFGTREVRSSDISAFKKWTAVIARFEDQMRTQSSSPRLMMWKAELQGLKDKSARAQIDGVNTYVNQVRYIEDSKNWHKSDYWATPLEFFSKGGDCEDFAIAKYASLRALGFSTDQLRIAIVQDNVRNIAHALLIVYTDEGTFVLDNQTNAVREAASVTRYTPIFSINANNWWLHRRSEA